MLERQQNIEDQKKRKHNSGVFDLYSSTIDALELPSNVIFLFVTKRWKRSIDSKIHLKNK